MLLIVLSVIRLRGGMQIFVKTFTGSRRAAGIDVSPHCLSVQRPAPRSPCPARRTRGYACAFAIVARVRQAR
ncbi:hypothetical protein B0H17DRAFT_1106802 [Mycena rosella]|uniref:Uncharacterized protein n=1 Tax=Mycena rosella TaxID=1033263 RepID=A0AAD7FTR6_MYCRO|nr:hypothetical protein B0H17DRAFT_1106802 [Mycena rosella]